MDKRDEDASEAFAWADRSIEYRFGGYAFTPAFSPNAEHIATLARLASLAAPAAPGREGIARARDAILADIRDRKLLKYLFDKNPESCGAYGYIEQPLDLDTQIECATAWTTLALLALKPGSQS